jgi:hypothetical protein
MHKDQMIMVHDDNVSNLTNLLGQLTKYVIISMHNDEKPKYIAAVCHR